MLVLVRRVRGEEEGIQLETYRKEGGALIVYWKLYSVDKNGSNCASTSVIRSLWRET